MRRLAERWGPVMRRGSGGCREAVQCDEWAATTSRPRATRRRMTIQAMCTTWVLPECRGLDALGAHPAGGR